MRQQYFYVLISATILCLLIQFTVADYWGDRSNLIKKDTENTVGSQIVLNDKEIAVNKILVNYKLHDFDDGILNPENFLPSQHFFKSKSAIENSNVFKIIQQLPKGASLHSHDTAIASQEFVYNLTFSENLYGCVQDEKLLLHFYKKGLTDETICKWKLISELRDSDPTFDTFLKSQLTLIVEEPSITYSDINVVWSKFMNIFGVVGPLISYKPVFEEYFYQCLKELYEDNVMYLEFRGVLFDVYDLDGKIYKNAEVVEMFVETLKRFKQDYPNFYGAKFIYAPSRKVSNQTMQEYFPILVDIQKKYPSFVAGFDLVGQEDLGQPLVNFIPELLSIKNETNFFFHAGETNWFGETDMNVFDAVLLGTKRIGHGYAALKHPAVLDIIKKNAIALEVSPLSNQVLKLVDDLRNHPANIFLTQNYPVVICCDDPSFWGAKGLSYDWYMAFMALSGRDSDLRLLKQLAINSLMYSTIEDKEDVLNKWNLQWDAFLDKILSSAFHVNELNFDQNNNVRVVFL